ncbi:MAG: hypothetical protein AAF735_00835 [Myxococcota bacterium]
MADLPPLQPTPTPADFEPVSGSLSGADAEAAASPAPSAVEDVFVAETEPGAAGANAWSPLDATSVDTRAVSVRAPSAGRPEERDPLDPQRLAEALAGYPDYRDQVVLAIDDAIANLDRRTGPQPRQLVQELAEARREIDRGEVLDASESLVAFVQATRGLVDEAEFADRLWLSELHSETLSAIRPPRSEHEAPARILHLADGLFGAYKRQSELALNSIIADGYSEAIDIFGERVRPDDARSGLMRMNVALWSVRRDLEYGRIGPAEFGVETWSDVDGRSLYDEALDRLEEDAIDFGALAPAMRADPAWSLSPVSVIDERGERSALDENELGFMHRSIYSLLFPNDAAEDLQDRPFANVMRDGAIRSAEAAPEDGDSIDREALIDTAFAFFDGHGTPQNASQALFTIATATEVPLIDVELAPSGTDEDTLNEWLESGDIAGFRHREGLPTLLYRPRTPQDVARDAAERLDGGHLDHFSEQSRRQLEAMLTGEPPGSALQARVDDEAWNRRWRIVSGQAVELAVIVIASGGIGAVAETAAVGARLSFGATQASRFLATTTSFTTLHGIATGELELAHYPRDALMFGALHATGLLSQLAARTAIPGTGTTARLMQAAAGHTGGVVSAAALVTGFGVLEQTLSEQTPDWDQIRTQFTNNLATVALVHTVNMGLMRVAPYLAPGAAIQRAFRDLELRAQRNSQELISVTSELRLLTQRANQANVTAAERAELATQTSAVIQRVERLAQEARTLHLEMQTFISVRAGLPPEQQEAIRRQLAPAALAASAGRDVRAARESLVRNTTFNYDTVPLRSVHRAEQRAGVRYFSAQERAAFEVFVRGGRLIDARGRPVETGDAGRPGHALFAMSADGRMYVGDRFATGAGELSLRHSSFLAGGPVAAAGEIRVENGRIHTITDQSGHYRPLPPLTAQFLRHLQRSGVELEGIRVDSARVGTITPAPDFLATHSSGTSRPR